MSLETYFIAVKCRSRDYLESIFIWFDVWVMFLKEMNPLAFLCLAIVYPVWDQEDKLRFKKEMCAILRIWHCRAVAWSHHPQAHPFPQPFTDFATSFCCPCQAGCKRSGALPTLIPQSTASITSTTCITEQEGFSLSLLLFLLPFSY